MSEAYSYVLNHCSKRYPNGQQVLNKISLSFLPGAKIGVLGHNGAGKSTLLKIMAGIDKNYDGEAWVAKNTKIGYLPQEPVLNLEKTVEENIKEALKETFELLDSYNNISNDVAVESDMDKMNALLEKQASIQDKIDHCKGWEVEHQMKRAMQSLYCPDVNAKVSILSGGERRRVALCKLLLEKPDLMLLDEPTNHLDAKSIAWLENWLGNYNGTIVMVTHDRYFLDKIADWILELENTQAYPYQGNYSAWLEQKQKRLDQESNQQKKIQKQLQEEQNWIKQNLKGGSTHSKHRIRAYEELHRKATYDKQSVSQIVIPPGERLGNQVVEAKSISIKVENKSLIKDLSFILPAGAILGIIGENGVGKTHLLKAITKEITLTSGELIIGDTVHLSYVNQLRDSLNDKNTVWQEISNGNDTVVLGSREIPSRSYVASFNFKSSDQQRIVSELSGGERNRVHLAKLLSKGGNLLLLDEPTNDLDVDTLRALEEALISFAGSAIVVSHDRWFLDRIVTHILSHEEEDNWTFFEGNYSDYIRLKN